MGYNTTVFILNDQFNRIEGDPARFVGEIGQHMYRGGQALGQTTVMRTEHADVFRLYGTHQNSIVDLSPWAAQTKELIARRPYIVRAYIDRARRQLDALEKLLPET